MAGYQQKGVKNQYQRIVTDRSIKIIEEYGIHPNNFAMARAVVGDKSDNLDGVSGVGLKTISKRFPFFAEERDVFLKELVEFCEKQESKLKVFTAITESIELIKENYDLMQLYSPSLSVQTKKSIDWTVKGFQFTFNKTGTDIMMLQDGINEINWSSMYEDFKRIQRNNKK